MNLLNTLINFPNKRIEYNTTGQPVFSGDILNSIENLLSAMWALLGLDSSGNDFRIIYGLNYNPMTTEYDEGLVYFNGTFYWFPNSYGYALSAGQYLIPDDQDTMLKVFQDSSSKNTYTQNLCTPTNVSGPTTTPVFTGYMNSYRLNMDVLNNLIIALQAAVANVYTKTEINIINANLLTKIVNIGNWNMDTTQTVDVAHGLADITKIRDVRVTILRDDSAAIFDLCAFDPDDDTLNGGVGIIEATNIRLGRVTGGYFDNANFDSLPFNRGYITIKYLP